MQTDGPTDDFSGKTGALKFSPNYVWNTADCLGRGATASVHLARHRTTGDVVAVKVFHERESRQIALARQRELDLLSAVKHKNVITLIAREKELSTGVEVLVMPYCQGGSLHTVLEQPQYGFGFPEDEFITFLEHIAAGIEYLRSRGIIHRDIKPGNIMKFIEENGRITYKLTDFGAARELGDEETFMSIYGTEEYLYPRMYERAVLHQPGQQCFGSNVDLWSLGVTIYHVVTGHLPFRPFGGRVNTQTMFAMTSKKETGVISGEQREKDGRIIWSKSLPDTCLLSQIMKKKITPLLAGVLEVDASKSWTYQKFFGYVKKIVNMVRFKIFNHCAGCEVTVFLEKHERYSDLQEKLAAETDIPSSSQLLLLNGKELTDCISSTVSVDVWPKTVFDRKFFIYNRDNWDYLQLPSPSIAPFPALRPDNSLSVDASEAKTCTSIAMYIERKTEQTLATQKRLKDAVDVLREYVRNQITPVTICYPECEEMMKLLEKRKNSIKHCQENLSNIYDILRISGYLSKESNKLRLCKPLDSEHEVSYIFKKACQRNEEIKVYVDVLLEKIKEQETDAIRECVGCQEEDHCLPFIRQMKDAISGVATVFLKHKRYAELHPHEVFIHKVEKQKLSEKCMNILSVFEGHCFRNTRSVYATSQKQTSLLMKHLSRTTKVATNMACVKECQRTIDMHLDKLEKDYFKKTGDINQVIPQKNSDQRTCDGMSFHPDMHDAERERIPGEQTKTTKCKLLETLVEQLQYLQMERENVDAFLQKNSETLKRYLQEIGHLRRESLEL